MRIDKFIWCVRLIKTRSKASKLVLSQNVKVDDEFCKPSRVITYGMEFSIKEAPIWRKFKILDMPKSRVGAKLVPELIMEITDKKDLDLLADVQRQNRENHSLGIKGRPTKKDRRSLDDFWDDEFYKEE